MGVWAQVVEACPTARGRVVEYDVVWRENLKVCHGDVEPFSFALLAVVSAKRPVIHRWMGFAVRGFGDGRGMMTGGISDLVSYTVKEIDHTLA
jgi:hypothetical protein